MHLRLTRRRVAAIVEADSGQETHPMRNLLMRSMAWMLIAATALVLFGLAQAPELWLGRAGAEARHDGQKKTRPEAVGSERGSPRLRQCCLLKAAPVSVAERPFVACAGRAAGDRAHGRAACRGSQSGVAAAGCRKFPTLSVPRGVSRTGR